MVLLCAGPARPAKEITQDQARHLVLDFLKAETKFTRLPKFGLDDYSDPYFPDFFFFEATWDNPHQPPASVVLGDYAVDRRTGDLWYGTVCWELKSAHLKRLQQAIRKRIGITEKEYRKLRRRGPMCLPGETPVNETTPAKHR